MLLLTEHSIKSFSQKQNTITRIMKEGFIAGKNPVLSLAYASGFAARGDSAVATTFISFWVCHAYIIIR